MLFAKIFKLKNFLYLVYRLDLFNSFNSFSLVYIYVLIFKNTNAYNSIMY